MYGRHFYDDKCRFGKTDEFNLRSDEEPKFQITQNGMSFLESVIIPNEETAKRG